MKINISRLSTGLHELDFEETAEELNIDHVKLFPNPIVSRVTIDRSETHIYIKATIRSKAHFSCDRCLKKFDQELIGDLTLYYEVLSQGGSGHLTDETGEENDSIRIFRPEMRTIDLTNDIRDTLLLTIPMKVLCSLDCKGICSGCGVDLNIASCVCVHDRIDPRWEELKKLLDQESKKS